MPDIRRDAFRCIDCWEREMVIEMRCAECFDVYCRKWEWLMGEDA